MSKEYELEIIVWLDHHSLPDGWFTKDEAIEDGEKLKLATSVGYVVSENKDVVIVASDISDEFFSRGISIAKKLIQSRRKLVIKPK